MSYTYNVKCTGCGFEMNGIATLKQAYIDKSIHTRRDHPLGMITGYGVEIEKIKRPSKTIEYEATIRTTDGVLEWVVVRKDLESLKQDAIKASLLWRPFMYYGDVEPGISIIRVYRVTPHNEQDLNWGCYRDLVGVAVNGKWYPIRIWWLMKQVYANVLPRTANMKMFDQYAEYESRRIAYDKKRDLTRYDPTKPYVSQDSIEAMFRAWRVFNIESTKGE